MSHRKKIHSPLDGLVAVVATLHRTRVVVQLVQPLALLLVVDLAPLDPPVLKPHLNLRFCQSKCVRQVQTLRTHLEYLFCKICEVF